MCGPEKRQDLCRNSVSGLEVLPCASVTNTFPAAGCSKLILPRGSLWDQAEGQLAATRHGAHPDQGERKQGSLCLPQPPAPPDLLFQGTSLRLRSFSGSKSKRAVGVPGSPPAVFLLSEVNTTHQRWVCTPERGHNPFCHSGTLSSSELLSDFHSAPASCQARIWRGRNTNRWAIDPRAFIPPQVST